MGDSVEQMDAADWKGLYRTLQNVATTCHFVGERTRERAMLDVLALMDRMSE